MVKKLAALAGAGALLLSVSGVAFGWSRPSYTKVSNETVAVADTGVHVTNGAGAYYSWVDDVKASTTVKDIKTGDATARAYGLAAADVKLGCYSCMDFGYQSKENRTVVNKVQAAAYTSVDVDNTASAYYAHADDVESYTRVEDVRTGDATAKAAGAALVDVRVTGWLY